MSADGSPAPVTWDESTERPDAALPDDEVDWEERLHREVVRTFRYRWRRLTRLMGDDRRRREPAPGADNLADLAGEQDETGDPGPPER
jgi:hypothetical protein